MAGLLDAVLPFVYSQGDRAKRAIAGLLGDPLGTAQQYIGNLNDEAGQGLGLLSASGPPTSKVTPREQAARDALINNLGAAMAGTLVYRAGSPQGMTADAGGPTFYSTQRKGAEPFSRGGQNPIREVDINPSSVLDTQLLKDKAVYEQFLKETGHPAGYGNSARPYWTAEYEFKKWLDSNGHKFDAVMFDEPTGIPSYAVYPNR